VINGDGESSTITASFGGSEAQADWLKPKVGGLPVLQMNQVNSRSGSATMIALETLSWLLLLLLV